MKRYAKKIVIIILFLPVILLPSAYDNLQYPPSLKWMELDTGHFILVFPSYQKKNAFKTARYLEENFSQLSFEKKEKTEKFTIFLNDQSSISNGYIQLAPKRGEFYLTPPQNMFLGNTEWLKGLAIHEARHTQQFSFLNRGFTKFSGILFGEIGRSALSFLSVPQWFWEGDAVRTETILTKGGRGRVSSFSSGLKAILLQGKKFSYTKAYLSSYRDFVPDIYKLGFYISSYVYKTFPRGTWKKVLKYSSGHSFLPFIFSESLKKFTGKNLLSIYNDSMEDVKNFWKEMTIKIKATAFKNLSPTNKRWTYYSSPKLSDDGSIIAQKLSLSEPLTMVKITPSGSEEKLFQINPMGGRTNIFSIRNNKIVWSEIRVDPRWGKRDYAEIIIYDLKTHKSRRLTKKSRVFSPAFSPDGKDIVAVKSTGGNGSRIVIIDVLSGRIKKEYINTDLSFLATPNWSDKKRIVITEEMSGKRRFTILDLESGEFNPVTTYKYENISLPLLYKNHIIYSSDINGVDNIYSLNILSGKKFRLTSSLFGAYYPEIDRKTGQLIYCNYDIKGSNIVSADLDMLNPMPFNNPPEKKSYLTQERLSEESPAKKNPKRNSLNNKVKKFSKLKDLINFHSRVIDPSTPEPGIIFMSDNKLNTLSLNTGFRYNTNEQGMILFFNSVYSGLFPKIHFSFSRRYRSSGSPENINWLEDKIKTDLELSFNLSSGVHYRNLSLKTGLALIHIRDQNREPLIKDGELTSLEYHFSYSSFRISAKRDIIPKGGHFFSILYKHSPFRSFYRGSLLSIYSGLILPGIKTNQQILLRGGYEQHNPGNYLFSSRLTFPRGYRYEFSRKFTVFYSDYIFPVFYPDIALGELIYIKRIRGDLFFDYGRGITDGIKKLYRTAGIEMKADFNLFSIPVELFGGFRLSYLIGKNTFSIEPLFFEIGF